MIRWKALLPALAVFALIGLLVRLCLGGIIERELEKLGTRANGAKVELAGVDLSFLHTSIVLRDLQITDAGEPMKNALEVAQLRFKLAPKPLFWKKIMVEDASITGIRTGTDRKRSGAISKSAAGREEEGGPGVMAETASFAWGNLKEQYDPKTLIQPDNLSSYKKAREEQVHYQAITGTWETRADALKSSDVEPRVKAFADRVKTEKYQGLEGIAKAKKDLDEAKELKRDAEALKKGFESLKTDLTAEIARAKDTVKSIDDLKRQDLEGALGTLKAGASPEGIAKGVIGQRWFGKVRGYLALVEKARAKIPKKKAGEVPPPPPQERKGRDIPFPFKYNWPTFHLVKAGLSGATGGDDPLDYEGTLKDVTSDPKRLGRPAVLSIAGAKAPRALNLDATLDYTREVPRERLQLTYAGLPLAGVRLGEAGGPVTIKEGRGKVSANVALTGPSLTGVIRLDAAPVALDHRVPADKAGNRLLSIVHDTLTSMNALDVAVRLSDTLSSPDFKLETSLDGRLKTAVTQALQKELEGIKAGARQRLDELVDGEKLKLAKQIDGPAAAALGKLGLKDKQVQAVQGQVQKLMDDLKNKSASSVLPAGDDGKPKLPADLKKLFKKR